MRVLIFKKQTPNNPASEEHLCVLVMEHWPSLSGGNDGGSSLGPKRVRVCMRLYTIQAGSNKGRQANRGELKDWGLRFNSSVLASMYKSQFKNIIFF